MALRRYINHTQEWLETRYFEIIDGLSSGKTVISVSAGDTSSTFQIIGNPWEQLSWVAFELHVRDPEKWPASVLMENRTRANHSV